ncbi:MAG: J domain-containing protein [Polyangiaceae bacterium]|jgi:curved DNA-binding protein CbpA
MATDGGRQDHYEVLGVRHDATDEVIRAAYRALAAKYHPDRNPDDRDAELKLKKLNAAFRVLGDAASRKQYDELTRGPEDHSERASAETTPNDSPPLFRTCRNCGAERKRAALCCDECGANYESWSAPRSPPEAKQPDPDPPRVATAKARGAGAFANLLKLAGYLFLALLVVIGGVAWYEKVQSDEYAAEQAAVTIEASYNPAACTQERPIRIAITNGAKSTLKSVSFALQAFENGRSDNLARDSDSLTSNAIVRPGETATRCRTFPTLIRDTPVFIRAEKKDATFYEPNEFIPRTDESSTVPSATPGAQSVWITEPGYRIAFPDNPRPVERHTETTRLGPATVTTMTLDRRGIIYWVRERDYPNGSVLDEQNFIAEELMPIGAEVHERAMIGNCNGRSFSAFRGSGVVTIRGLFCVSGAHAYEATVTINDPPSADDAKEAASFLGSFAISATPAVAKTGSSRP